MHLGVINQDEIDNMPMPFFDSILKELQYKINYDAVVNYAGNSFVPESWDMITKADPFNVENPQVNMSSAVSGLGKFFASNPIQIIEKGGEGSVRNIGSGEQRD